MHVCASCWRKTRASRKHATRTASPRSCSLATTARTRQRRRFAKRAPSSTCSRPRRSVTPTGPRAAPRRSVARRRALARRRHRAALRRVLRAARDRAPPRRPRRRRARGLTDVRQRHAAAQRRRGGPRLRSSTSCSRPAPTRTRVRTAASQRCTPPRRTATRRWRKTSSTTVRRSSPATDDGRTALAIAEEQGHDEVAALLRERA